jgi:pilus assembly protein CpaB
VGTLSLVLRKPGEQNNPVVETVSMNDLRYNMYGGARYPAPAVVGGFGSAVASSITHTATTISRTHSVSTAKPKVAPAESRPNVEVYRGTKSDKVKVEG